MTQVSNDPSGSATLDSFSTGGFGFDQAISLNTPADDPVLLARGLYDISHPGQTDVFDKTYMNSDSAAVAAATAIFRYGNPEQEYGAQIQARPDGAYMGSIKTGTRSSVDLTDSIKHNRAAGFAPTTIHSHPYSTYIGASAGDLEVLANSENIAGKRVAYIFDNTTTNLYKITLSGDSAIKPNFDSTSWTQNAIENGDLQVYPIHNFRQEAENEGRMWWRESSFNLALPNGTHLNARTGEVIGG